MGISTKGDASDVLDLQSYSIKAQCDPEEISDRINETLSRIAYTFVKDKPFSGIYITGGDTALAFFDVSWNKRVHCGVRGASLGCSWYCQK